VGHVACMGEMKNSHKILVINVEGLLGRPWHRWHETIKVGLKGNRTLRCGLDSTGSDQGPGSCEHGNESSGYIFFINLINY